MIKVQKQKKENFGLNMEAFLKNNPRRTNLSNNEFAILFGIFAKKLQIHIFLYHKPNFRLTKILFESL